MKVYLAGPMRGLPDGNRDAFETASKWLRDYGYQVESPMEHKDAQGWGSVEDPEVVRKGMAYGLQYVTLEADLVLLLPGWMTSKGARAEVAAAEAVGTPVRQLYDFMYERHGQEEA